MADLALDRAPGAEAPVKGEGPGRKAHRRFMRHRLAVAGVGVLGLMVLLALLAPWIRRYSPIELDLAAMSQAPSAARWLGTDTTVRHMFPNVVGTVTAAATFGVASAILQEAALSFLGLGVHAPTPSWRNMLRDAQTRPSSRACPGCGWRRA